MAVPFSNLSGLDNKNRKLHPSVTVVLDMNVPRLEYIIYILSISFLSSDYINNGILVSSPLELAAVVQHLLLLLDKLSVINFFFFFFWADRSNHVQPAANAELTHHRTDEASVF